MTKKILSSVFGGAAQGLTDLFAEREPELEPIPVLASPFPGRRPG